MRNLVLILIAFIAVVTFIRVFDSAGAQTPDTTSAAEVQAAPTEWKLQ